MSTARPFSVTPGSRALSRRAAGLTVVATGSLDGFTREGAIEAIIAGAPEQMGLVTGRLSEPEEVASLICFLLSERANNTTGADYLIDGGAIRSH